MSAALNPENDPAEWLRFAASDLAIARCTQDDPEILPSQIGFHAQQAAEKAIKGAMLHHGIPFPKTHDLDELVALWKNAQRPWPEAFDGITEMTIFAVRARYPGDIDPPMRADAAEAILLAEQILAWAGAALGQPKKNSPA